MAWSPARAAVCILACIAAAAPAWAKPAAHKHHAARAAIPELAINIRNTPSPDDDYVTWAPAPAQLVMRATGQPITVVLANESAPAPGRGRVNFASDAAAYKQAIDAGRPGLDTITLRIAPGQTQPFVIAGAFPYYSRQDKDVVVVAHLGTRTGAVLARQRLMVRVRRNLETLTADEKSRYLWAMTALRFDLARERLEHGNSYFDLLVEIHDIGARGYPDGAVTPDSYPDQEHKDPAFLPWHRAFLVLMERALQKIDPSVTLPYWPIYRAPNAFGSEVFHPDFTGGNRVTPLEPDQKPTETPRFAVPEPSDFSIGNPLYGWFMQGRGALSRWTYNRGVVAFNKPGDLINRTDKTTIQGDYYFATNAIESDPHNVGHNWTGVWMSNCRISPSDPGFWPFHTYFDWLWAAWQQNYGRFGTDGADKRDYWPNDAYPGTGGAAQIPIGHHLKDTMWPWNGVTTQPSPTVPFNLRRPPTAPGGLFPASGVAGVWPQAPAKPTPAEMIDYAGYNAPANDTDIAYDSIPWSPRQALPPFPGDAVRDHAALALVLDDTKPLDARLAASEQVDLGDATAADKIAALRAIAVAEANPPALRTAALHLLLRVDTTEAVSAAHEMRGTAAGDPMLRAEIRGALELQMFAGKAGTPEARPAPAEAAVSANRGDLYRSARSAAPGNSVKLVLDMAAQVEAFLRNPQTPADFPPQDAVDFIVATNVLLPDGSPADAMAMPGMAMGVGGISDSDRARVRHALRDLLRLNPARPVDPSVDLWRAKGLAALALVGDPDPATRDLIVGLVIDRTAPVPARSRALLALSHFDQATFLRFAGGTADSANEPAELRGRAAAAVGAFVVDNAGKLDRRTLELIHKLGVLWTGPREPDALKKAGLTVQRLAELSERALGGTP